MLCPSSNTGLKLSRGQRDIRLLMVRDLDFLIVPIIEWGDVRCILNHRVRLALPLPSVHHW